MIDPEVGFLIETRTEQQAIQLVAQRFKINPKEIVSIEPDTQVVHANKLNLKEKFE